MYIAVVTRGALLHTLNFSLIFVNFNLKYHLSLFLGNFLIHLKYRIH